MNYEEKFNELDQRIAKLEKIEKRRKIISWIQLGIKIVIIIVVCYFVYNAYSTLMTYKQKLDELKNVEDKLNNTEDYLNEQLNKIQNFNIFN